MSEKITNEIQLALSSLVTEVRWSINMPVIIADKNNIEKIAQILKSNLDFDMFLDVTAVDWLNQNQPTRFEVVLHFYSSSKHTRVRLKAWVSEDDLSVPTLIHLYGSAHYMERECHEMYGIKFAGNPDLRPILLYEGFVGHPLRKDYEKNHKQPIVPMRDPTIPCVNNIK